jgi:hypothetical protein
MTKGERFIRCRIEMIGERALRHVDRGSSPRRVQSGGAAPKGDTLFHLCQRGRDRNIYEEYKHECYHD